MSFRSEKKEFMTFQAYEKVDFKQPIKDKEFTVMVNPESFSKSINVHYKKEECMANSISAGRFSGMDAVDYSFSLLLDGTGIISQKPEYKDVKAQLNALTEVLFAKTGESTGYRPNYVSITYCDESLHCVVSSLKTEYSLFRSDGTPLRAKVTCSFKSVCQIETGEIDGEALNKRREREKGAFDSFKDTISQAMDEEADSLFNLFGR